MSSNLPRAELVPVTDPLATMPADYADAYAVDLPSREPELPHVWVRAGLAAVPPVVDRIVERLGFKTGAGDPLDEWQTHVSTPEVVHLAVALPLLHVDFIGRNVTPTRRMLTTVVRYTRPWLGRLVMTLIKPGHRFTARRLVTASLGAERVDG